LKNRLKRLSNCKKNIFLKLKTKDGFKKITKRDIRYVYIRIEEGKNKKEYTNTNSRHYFRKDIPVYMGDVFVFHNNDYIDNLYIILDNLKMRKFYLKIE